MLDVKLEIIPDNISMCVQHKPAMDKTYAAIFSSEKALPRALEDKDCFSCETPAEEDLVSIRCVLMIENRQAFCSC